MAWLSFSTLRCGSWIDAFHQGIGQVVSNKVSVPFDAGRGLMHASDPDPAAVAGVSVPFDAGRGLMPEGINERSV